MRAADDQRQVCRQGQDRAPALLHFLELGYHDRGGAGRCDLLGRACECVERLERCHPLQAAGQSGQDRRQNAIAHDLPVGTDGNHQVPATFDPIDQRTAAQSIECGEDLAVVGIDDDGPRGVIPVPSAGQQAGLRINPCGDNLVDAGVVGAASGDLEARQLDHGFNTLRAAECEDQVFTRHDRFRTLRHRGVLGSTTGAPAV